MGEARLKTEASARATEELKGKAVPLTLLQGVVVLQLDLASNMLGAMAHQLGAQLGQTEAAKELQKSAEHLQTYKARFMSAAQSKVVLASAADLPRP